MNEEALRPQAIATPITMTTVDDRERMLLGGTGEF